MDSEEAFPWPLRPKLTRIVQVEESQNLPLHIFGQTARIDEGSYMDDKNHRITLLLGVALIINLTFAPAVLADPRGVGWAIRRLINDSKIHGTIYHDWNANGVRDLEEPPMPGIRVSLEDPRCDLLLSAISDSDGTYAFPGLIMGTYLITAEDAPGYCSTTPNSFLVEIGFGQKIEINFGDLLVIPGCFPAIAGQVFEDLNTSGERDDGEPLLSNVLVTLSSEDGSLTIRRFTDEFGRYLFEDLATGRYTVTETNPEEYPVSTTPDEVDVLIEGPMPVEVHFGDRGAS